jgi:hypothetical protein
LSKIGGDSYLWAGSIKLNIVSYDGNNVYGSFSSTGLAVTGDSSNTSSSSSTVYKIINTLGSGNRYSQLQFFDGVTQKAQIYQNLNDGNISIRNNTASGSIVLLTNDTANTMILDASGNLGLGVTPSGWSAAYRTIESGVTGGNYGVFWSSSNTDGGANAYGQIGIGNNNSAGSKYAGNGASSFYLQSGGRHSWYNAPSGTAGNTITWTQAMTLDSSGNLLVGTTSIVDPHGAILALAANFPKTPIEIRQDTINTHYAITFRNANGLVGNIVTYGSSTSFNTSSDYRLKENIVPMQGALGLVLQLKPVTYNWKADGSNGQGFIAHELQSVVPDCVTGEKDAVDAEGNPVYQGVDTSFLVGILTKAIQELSTKNDALEARLAALENK